MYSFKNIINSFSLQYSHALRFVCNRKYDREQGFRFYPKAKRKAADKTLEQRFPEGIQGHMQKLRWIWAKSSKSVLVWNKNRKSNGYSPASVHVTRLVAQSIFFCGRYSVTGLQSWTVEMKIKTTPPPPPPPPPPFQWWENGAFGFARDSSLIWGAGVGGGGVISFFTLSKIQSWTVEMKN